MWKNSSPWSPAGKCSGQIWSKKVQRRAHTNRACSQTGALIGQPKPTWATLHQRLRYFCILSSQFQAVHGFKLEILIVEHFPILSALCKMTHENLQQVKCISGRFKHNLEFENKKQTEHSDLKDGITTCIMKQPLPSGQGFLLYYLLIKECCNTVLQIKKAALESNCSAHNICWTLCFSSLGEQI